MSKKEKVTVPVMGDTTIVMNLVDIKDGIQSNKYYNMIPDNDGLGFLAEYGRIGSTKTKHKYRASEWERIYKSRIKKGYKDHTNLVATKKTVASKSTNTSFAKFASFFGDATMAAVSGSYNIKNCTDAQLAEANKILADISNQSTVKTVNNRLLKLFSVIPRKMQNVNNYLIEDMSDLLKVVSREQDALDSMNSSNIIQGGTDILGEMDLEWEECHDWSYIMEVINGNAERHYPKSGIKAIYKITKTKQVPVFERVSKDISHSDACQHLIHGTRSANIFSILKSGLIIRPSNAHWSGSNYGDGIYHSADAFKSLGYTGSDKDRLLLIQKVNMGNPYEYKGWQRTGKGIAVEDMNEKYLRANGYDSIFVSKGDGLRASEMIVYNSKQTISDYLIWTK